MNLHVESPVSVTSMLRGQVGRLRLPHGIPINNLNQETTIHCITSFRYNLVPKKVHACTTRGTCMYFFHCQFSTLTSAPAGVDLRFNFQLVLRLANRFKYQPHLIAGEVA